ncbi:acetyltransferase [Enterococcus sp. JM4C]|uniref:GNAT family N-acetyltransferase n=1 Tax=Candidatus Enterococcus huntleyi TaxID=1857217 RepID=UPI00137A64BC|nr:GNAT family protein [Enterococcus sp. JM4C]KAF1295837.1 acetyltransferase [Enterococcus sp. JM4C]
MDYRVRLVVDEQVSLIHPTMSMAEDIFRIVDTNREHLRPYLDFVDATQSVTDEENYFKLKLTGEANGTDRLFLIEYEGTIVGNIDLHFISALHQRAEIGYMLGKEYTKKGIMTRSVKKICALAFEEMGLNKLSIVADVENQPSNQVALSCGFTFVGVDRQDTNMYGELRDMNRYALLKEEFNQ